MPFQAVDNASNSDIATLVARLDAFNMTTTKIFDARSLSIIMKRDGELYAGLHGSTWGGSCEITSIWVAKADRGRGLGSDLLRSAEREARARGCRQIVLATHSFQAPGFYEKEGYRRVGTIENVPAGHANIYMIKRLEP
jgi:ribosomal protein S18 acetylase RimI-like enzyme